MANAKAKAARPAWNAREVLQPFPGWLLIDDAAAELGVSRQAVHRMVERGTIRPRDARILGRDPDRPLILVVREKAIAELPMTPQRARELRLRQEAAGSVPDGDEPAGLG